MKTIRLIFEEGTKLVSANDSELKQPEVLISDDNSKYGDGVLFEIKSDVPVINFRVECNKDVHVLFIDAYGNSNEHTLLVSGSSSTLALNPTVKFIFIIDKPIQTQGQIKSAHLIDKPNDWLCKNKFGVYQYLDEQCPNNCLCGQGCKSDDLFFNEYYLYEAYRQNMQSKNKGSQKN
jgi:hypothetical protein